MADGYLENRYDEVFGAKGKKSRRKAHFHRLTFGTEPQLPRVQKGIRGDGRDFEKDRGGEHQDSVSQEPAGTAFQTDYQEQWSGQGVGKHQVGWYASRAASSVFRYRTGGVHHCLRHRSRKQDVGYRLRNLLAKYVAESRRPWAQRTDNRRIQQRERHARVSTSVRAISDSCHWQRGGNHPARPDLS